MSASLGSQRRTLYTIAEAADLANCAVDELIRAGAAGQLRFCIKVPHDVSVYSVESGVLRLEHAYSNALAKKMDSDRYLEHQAILMDNIKFLFVNATDCGTIESLGTSAKSEFRTGAGLTEQNVLSEVRPIAPKRSTFSLGTQTGRSIFGRVLCTYPNNHPIETPAPYRHGRRQPIVFATNELHVAAADLELFLTSGGSLAGASHRDDTFPVMPYTSKKLRYLYLASNLWERARDPNKSHADYLKFHSGTIVPYLREAGDGCLGSDNLVVGAARLIRPLFARREGPKHLGGADALDFRTPELRALRTASHLWEYVEHDSAPSNEQVKNALRVALKEQGIGENGTLLRIGPAILRLESRKRTKQ